VKRWVFNFLRRKRLKNIYGSEMTLLKKPEGELMHRKYGMWRRKGTEKTNYML